MSILIAKNNLHQNCLRTSTKKKKKLNLLRSQTNPNYSSKNPQNRSCDRLVQSVCSRYGLSLRQKLITNIHQPNLTSANYSNLFSFTLLLSLSLSLSTFVYLWNHYFRSLSNEANADLLKRSACSRSEHHHEEGRWLSGEGIDRQQHNDRGRWRER